MLDNNIKKENVHILVVDDEPTVREVLVRTLASEGYKCQTAASVDEALAKLSSAEFDLVMTDIMMPGRSGMELLQEVQRQWPDTAVMMITAVVDTQTAIQAMKLGAYDYVLKPFNLDDVRLSVDRALEKQRLILANREYQESLERKVEEQTAEISRTYLGALQALAEALEAKDPYTNGHTRRVTEIAVTLAKEKGLSEDEIRCIRLAGLLHDLGKIGVPDEILHKPGRLAEEEFNWIKEHPERSEKILRTIIKDKEVLAIIKHHHERYAGGGYPEGISGDKIPFGARLLSVADAYDAMTSNRPYRRAMSPQEAREQLLSNRGSQFDPEAVDLFIKAEKKMPFCPLSAAPGKATRKKGT